MYLFSRVLLVIVMACAAVQFVMGQHASEVSDGGEKLFLTPYKRFALLSSEPGRLTRKSSDTAQKSWEDPDRDAPPVPHLQAYLHRKGHLGNNPNILHNQQMSQVHKGRHWGGVKPVSGAHTHSDPQLSRMNHHLSHTKSQNGGLSGFVAPNNDRFKPRHMPIIRKSSQLDRLLPPRSAPQAQKAYENDPIPRSGTQPESRSEDKVHRQSPDNSPTSFRNGGYWRSQTYTNGRSVDNKETNAVASNIHARKFPSFFNQRSFIIPSASTSKDSSVTKPEKLTSPITQFSQGRFPPNGEKTSYKRVQSSLLRHSHTSDAQKGVNAPNLKHNTYKGQDFDQQTSRSNLKSVSKGVHPASVIFRAPKKNPLTPYENADNVRNTKSGQADARWPVQPSENGQLKESFNLNNRLTSWSNLKKNSQPSIYSKDANFESSYYRRIRPSRLQKYSFEQRITSNPIQEPLFRHSSSEILDATTHISPSVQQYRSPSVDRVEISGAVSGLGQNEEQVDHKPLAESADVFKSVTVTTVGPQLKTDQQETTLMPFTDSGAKEVTFKALTYDDIIGSASFSSVEPAEMVQDEKHFAKSTFLQKTVHLTGVNMSQTNGTEESSIAGKMLDFRKGEAETELGISDGSVSEEESEAKNVPYGLLSDPKENIESDSLLELDYLRTSTGNVSFQSLNLNL